MGNSHSSILGRRPTTKLEFTRNQTVISVLHSCLIQTLGMILLPLSQYFLPHHSISILPDCKTVVYNIQRVNSQHNARTFHLAKESNKNAKWEMWQETIPTVDKTSVRSKKPQEHMILTKDTTDYLWYTTSFNLEGEDLPVRRDMCPVIQVSSLGHAMHAFVNGEYIGSGHGNNIDKCFSFQKSANLKPGTNHITFLSMTVGLPACLGKSSCVLPAKAKAYGADESCSGSMFTLAVQAKCIRAKKNAD